MRMVAAVLLASCIAHASAQPASAPPAPAQPGLDRTLPAEHRTEHTIQLAAGPLAFAALAGSVRPTNGQGAPEADLATLAFVANPLTPRPITFAINGGPGASSAWLNLGAIGPWRVDAAAAIASPSASASLHDNPDTWLDMTDLVFVDAPGTGYSRILANGDDTRRRIYSVNGDISILADAIRRWLESHHRMTSPVYIVGESYGGFRAPRLARVLATNQGIAVRGIALISPVIDFSHRSDIWDPMPCVFALPSQVATARHAPDRAAVADAERYARGDFMLDLWRGERDTAAMSRVSARVAELIPALDPAVVRQHLGCLDTRSFLRELYRRDQRVGSAYDGTATAADPFPAASRSYAPDPTLDSLRPAFTTAMHDEYERLLGWTPEGHYELLSADVIRQWQWGNSTDSPTSFTELRLALAADPAFRVIVMHGLYDLVTPYLASQAILDQVPDLGAPDRIALRVHPGGHMFYINDASRALLHEDGAWLLQK